MNRIPLCSRSGLVFSLAIACCAGLTGCGGSNGSRSGGGNSHFVSDLEPGRPITARDAGRNPVEVRQPSSGSSDSTSDAQDERASRLRPVDSTAGNTGSDRPFAEDEALILGEANQPANVTNSPTPSAGEEVWSILLRSVATETHQTDAREIQAVFAQAAPQLRSMWINSNDKGSMVLYGRFAGVDDPAAQEALRGVKNLEVINNGARTAPFFAAMLVKIESAGDGLAQNFHPHDLRTVRRAHPRVDPLYTLQLAAWVGPEEDDNQWNQYRRQAEQYAGQLRTQGHEAWFYHDDTARISSVTIGTFDRRVINQASGLPSLELTQLYDQFPRHLVNGEELLVLENPRDPDSRRIPQAPMLVEVPVDLD